MHEVGLVDGIVEAVQRRAGSRPVAAFRVRIGALHRAYPGPMEQALELVAAGTNLDGAVMTLVQVPVTMTCRSCAAVATSDDIEAVCSGAADRPRWTTRAVTSSPSSRSSTGRRRRPQPAAEGAAMCLGIPGRVVELATVHPDLARVDVEGVVRDINLGLLEDDPAAVGDWVLIHLGFALQKMTEAEAKDAMDVLTDLGQGDGGADDPFAAFRFDGEDDPLAGRLDGVGAPS